MSVLGGIVGAGRKAGRRSRIVSLKSLVVPLSVVSIYSRRCRRSASLTRFIHRYCWTADRTSTSISAIEPIKSQLDLIREKIMPCIIAVEAGRDNALEEKLYVVFTRMRSLYLSFTFAAKLSR